MKRAALVFFAFLPCLSSWGDTKHLIDSLQEQLRATGYDTNKVNVLVSLSSVIRKENMQSSHVYAKEALNLARDLKFKPGIANSLLLIGYIYDEKGNFETALDYYKQSLEIREEIKDKQGISRVCNNIGLTYVKMGDVRTGLEYYFRSLRLKEEMGDKKGIANSLNNIGVIYRKQDNFEKALEYYLKAGNILEEINDKNGIAQNLNNIGNIYYLEEDYDKAIDYQLKALTIREELQDPTGIARSLTNIAGIYYKQANYPKALDYQFKALKIFEDMGSAEGIIFSYNNIGSLYSKAGNHALALVYSNKSLRLAEEIGSKEDIKLACLSLAETHATLGNFREAYDFHARYSSIADTLLNEENQSIVAEMEARYENDAKEREIELRTKKKAKDMLQLQSDNLKLYFISGGGLLALAVLVFLFIGNRQKHLANQLLKQQNNEISDQKDIIQEKTASIMDSLHYAERIQKAMLPAPALIKKHLPQSFIFYQPKQIVSGDFYWVETIRLETADLRFEKENAGDASHLSSHISNLILFAVADCTGHGVPGAFLSMVCHNQLTRAVTQHGLTRPADILNHVNRQLNETLQQQEGSAIMDGMDIALCSYQPATGLLQFAGANNPLWLFRKSEIIEVKADKFPIGAFLGQELGTFTNHEVHLQKGDRLYIFSDGYADQFGGPEGKKFKQSSFRNLLLSFGNQPLPNQEELLRETFQDWKGELEQVDDVCVIGLRI